MMSRFKVIQFLGAAPIGRAKKQGVGGAEVFVFDLISHMSLNKYEHTIIFAGDSPMKDKFLENKFEVINFRLKTKFDIWGIVRLAKIIKTRRADIIHSHGVRFDFAGAIISLLLGKPLIITRHVVISDDLLPFWKKVMYMTVDWFSLTIARSVIAISDYCRREILKNYLIDSNKIKTIYCAINFDEFDIEETVLRNYREEFGISTNAVVIGTIAQLRYHKGLDLLIRTIPEVISKFPNAIFLIIGEGPERFKLEHLSQTTGVNQNVRFLGYRPDVRRIMQLFDVFALTSRREGLPLVILEAMYAKRPIVATNVGAVGEVVKTGVTGILVESLKVEQIARAIIELLSSRKTIKEQGENAHRLVLEKFDILKAVSNYASLYIESLRK